MSAKPGDTGNSESVPRCKLLNGRIPHYGTRIPSTPARIAVDDHAPDEWHAGRNPNLDRFLRLGIPVIVKKTVELHLATVGRRSAQYFGTNGSGHGQEQ
ncbi:MAG: hypothetical protein NTV93_18760 [Verrucomicrobia bacterium]|nr:hypothetical protein [Verrucomicrobiota bacterium]